MGVSNFVLLNFKEKEQVKADQGPRKQLYAFIIINRNLTTI